MNDLEIPMGNVELRLSLSNLESEIVEVKNIAIDTHSQTKKTNGRVTLLEKFMYSTISALPLLTGLTGWLAIDYLNHRDERISQEEIQQAVQTALIRYEQEVNE